MKKTYWLFMGLALLISVSVLVSADVSINNEYEVDSATYITDYSAWQSYNYGAYDYLYVRSSGIPLNQRILLNISALSEIVYLYNANDITNIEAYLYMYCNFKSGDTDEIDLDLHILDESFTEGVQVGFSGYAVNYSYKDTGVHWTNDFGTYSDDISKRIVDGTGWYRWNISSYIEYCFDVKGGFYGMLMKPHNENNSVNTYWRFFSDDYSTSAFNPYVTVNFTLVEEYSETYFYNTTDECGYYYNYSVTVTWNETDNYFSYEDELISTNATCVSNDITMYENILNATGTHEYIYDSDTGFFVWANYTGNSSGGCSYPMYFNLSNDNVTVNITVIGESSAELTNSSVNEDNWFYVSGLSLDPSLMLFVFIGFFYYFATKKKANTLYFLTVAISLIAGVYYLGWEVDTTSRILGIALILFSIYCSYEAVASGMSLKK